MDKYPAALTCASRAEPGAGVLLRDFGDDECGRRTLGQRKKRPRSRDSVFFQGLRSTQIDFAAVIAASSP